MSDQLLSNTIVMYTRTAALFGLGQAGKIHFKNILNNTRIDLKDIVEERTDDAEKFIADYRLPGTRAVHSSHSLVIQSAQFTKAHSPFTRIELCIAVEGHTSGQ